MGNITVQLTPHSKYQHTPGTHTHTPYPQSTKWKDFSFSKLVGLDLLYLSSRLGMLDWIFDIDMCQNWQRGIRNLNWLVVEPTPLKNLIVKIGSSSLIFRGENSKNIWVATTQLNHGHLERIFHFSNPKTCCQNKPIKLGIFDLGWFGHFAQTYCWLFRNAANQLRLVALVYPIIVYILTFFVHPRWCKIYSMNSM